MSYNLKSKRKRKFKPRRQDLKSTLRMNKSQIKMQIERLSKDNQVLKERIAVIESTVPRTSVIGKKIADLSDQETQLRRRYHSSTAELEMMRNKLRNLESKLLNKKKDTGGVNHNAAERRRMHNQIKVLENRLDRMLAQYNKSIAENRKLREQIETLKEERLVFDGIYRKMEKELEMKKVQMARKIEESNNAFEEREHSKKELENTRQQKQQILMDFQEKSSKLDDIIVQNKVVQEFLKGDPRQGPPSEYSHASDSGFSQSPGQSPGLSPSVSTESLTRRDASYTKTNLKSLLAKKRKDGLMAKLRHQHLENDQTDLHEVFAELERELGLTPDELIQSITETEENNFSLYQHSNELNADIQVFDQEITTLRSKIESYVSGKKSNEERKRNRMFQNLQQTIQDCEETRRKYEDRILATGEVFEQIMGPLKDLHEYVGCDKDIIVARRGDYDITEGNMMLFLSYIEQKIDNLMRLYLHKKKKGTAVSVGPTTPKFVREKKKIKIKPPSSTFIEESGSEGRYEEPMTRDELIRKFGK